MYCLFMLLPFGAYKRPALETELSTIADNNDIGQGKLQADLANLVAGYFIFSINSNNHQ